MKYGEKMKSIRNLQHFLSLLFFKFGYSSSDGNIGGDGYERKPWSVPSSVRTIHGFDLSQVQDLDNMENNGATVTDSSGDPVLTGLYSGPYFDLEQMKLPREFLKNGGDVLSGRTNVTTQVGSSAILPCVVKQVGSNTVSWVRKRDSHILTVDKTVFISDPRFRILRLESGSDWDLHIKPIRRRDKGFYECQISTVNKMSFRVYLNVIVPDVIIEGSPDIHAQSGSSVTLKCLVQNATQTPNSVSWYRDKKRLRTNTRTTMVSDVNEKHAHGSSRRQLHHYQNLLTLASVRLEHSGLYSCVPSSGLPNATVNLHVVKGETLAAMSDDHRSSSGNLSGEEQSGNVDDERVSSSLQTKQNSNPTDIATSGASYTQNRISIAVENISRQLVLATIAILIMYGERNAT